MTLRCCRRSITASSPAHRASADLPVPARPPSETMPISGSSSRSSATRCSALRPRRPKASRSPRTSWTDLSGRTRPERAAVGRGEDAARCGRAGRGRPRTPRCLFRTAARCHRCRRSSSVIPVQPESTGSSARYSCAASPTDGGLDPQRQVLADQDDVLALGGQAARHRQDARVVVTQPEPGGQHRRVGVVEFDPDRAAERRRPAVPRPACRARCAGHRGAAGPGGRSSPVRDGAAWLPAR